MFTRCLSVPLRTQPLRCNVEAVGAVAKSSEHVKLDLKPSSTISLYNSIRILHITNTLFAYLQNEKYILVAFFCFVITLQLLA